MTDHPHGDDLAPAIRAKARAEAFREAAKLLREDAAAFRTQGPNGKIWAAVLGYAANRLGKNADA